METIPRETFTITTTNGHTVKLNTFITRAEARQISEVWLNKSAADVERIFAAEDLSLKLVVVEIDGSSENITQRILALPLADSNEIVDAVKPIVDGKKKTVTETPSSTSLTQEPSAGIS